MNSLRHSLRNGLLLFLVLGAGGAAVSAAEQEVVQFDPATTKVDFTLGSLLHTVHGSFRLKSGEIRFDRVTGTASGALVVDAASGNSGNNARDRKMKRDVLQTGRYPDIVFNPTHVSGTLPADGNATLNVQGLFRIHGADHDMMLSVPVTISGGMVSLRTEFLVPYVAWGMKNPSTFILRVDDKVRINVAGTARIGVSQSVSGRQAPASVASTGRTEAASAPAGQAPSHRDGCGETPATSLRAARERRPHLCHAGRRQPVAGAHTEQDSDRCWR